MQDNDNPLLEALNALKLATQKDMMVGLPSKVLSYDDKLQLAQIECGIQKSLGNGNFETLSAITHVPVQFAGSAEWISFHELPAGTEGYAHFSQRAIDNWIDRGGPVPPSDGRLFNKTDAFFAPGYRSAVTRIPGLPTSGIGISNASGTIRIHLTDNGIEFKVGNQVLSLTSEGLEFNGTSFINNGTTDLNGRTEITEGGLSVDGTEFIGHTHGGVQRGDGQTDGLE